MKRHVAVSAALICGLPVIATAAQAQSVEEFYKGKSITVATR